MLSPGDIVGGKYRIEKRIGRGGMGMVYEGVHTQVRRRVAIKVLHAHLLEDAQTVRRFAHEAQAAARIGSEHIVDVFDVGELATGEHFMVMELLRGESVSSMLKRKAPQAGILAIVLELLEGLAAAHEARIVHRDLKPGNILVTESSRKRGPRVKILDFGVSKFRDLVGEGSTSTGTLMGTPHYIAPEQVNAREVDGRADLYSVGVILFQAATGRYPYDANTFPELIGKLLTVDAPPVATVADVPPALAALIDRALARDPDHRFQSATQMGAALRQYLTMLGEPMPAIPEPRTNRVAVSDLQTPSSQSLAAGGDVTTLLTPTSHQDMLVTEVLMTPVPSSHTPMPSSHTPMPSSHTPMPSSHTPAPHIPISQTPSSLQQPEQASLASQTVSARRGGGRSSAWIVVGTVLLVGGVAAGAIFYGTALDPQPTHDAATAPSVTQEVAQTEPAAEVEPQPVEAAGEASAEPTGPPSATATASASSPPPSQARLPVQPRARPTPAPSTAPAPKPTQRTDVIREDL